MEEDVSPPPRAKGREDAKRASDRALDPRDPFLSWPDLPEGIKFASLVAGRIYRLLPLALIRSLQREVSSEIRDAERLEIDASLAAYAEHHPGLVGYCNGRPIIYPHLASTVADSSASDAAGILVDFSEEDVRSVGLDPRQLRQHLPESLETLSTQRRVLQARCGWLMTNLTYLEEEAAIRGQIPIRPTQTEPVPPEQVRQHLGRWSLVDLVAPGLPIPPGLQMMPVTRSSMVPPHLQGRTVQITLPYFHPLPSGDEVRAWIDRANPLPQAHEAEWRQLTDSGNSGKKSLDRFARYFRVQHYWRVLHTRYPDAMTKASLTSIRHCLADYLDLTPETLRRDLRDIDKRLGLDWALRP